MVRMISVMTAALIAAGTLHAAAPQHQVASHPVQGTSAGVISRSAIPRVLPGTRPGIFTTIQGNALDSTNGRLANTLVRLRDARFGRIVDTQLTDVTGLFAFRAVDPGTYIVEIVNADQSSVLAASQILSVNAGEAISAVVKLPIRPPAFAALLGATTTPTAAVVTSEAAASGLLATKVAGAPTCALQ